MTDRNGALERAEKVIRGNLKPMVTLTKEEADALVSEIDILRGATPPVVTDDSSGGPDE